MKRNTKIHGNNQRELLLISPPFFRPENAPIPMGIPLIRGFLQQRLQECSIRTLDMNKKYIERMLFYKVLMTLIRRLIILLEYCRRRKISNKRLLQKICIVVLNTFQNYLTNIALMIEETEFKEIPWSVKKIPQVLINHTIFKSRIARKIKNILIKWLSYNRITDLPSFIGISVIYPRQFYYSLLIAICIKKLSPSSMILLGGSFITKNIELLASMPNLYGIIDKLVRGDGCGPLKSLIGKSSSQGLSTKDKNTYIISNPKLTAMDRYDIVLEGPSVSIDQTHVMPDFGGFDSHFYSPENILPVRASIGCFWGKCAFCTYPVIGAKKYTILKIDTTVEIFSRLNKKYPVAKFRFVDDTLSLPLLIKLSKCIISKNLQIRWSGSITFFEDLRNSKYCELIRRAGCSELCLGLETASPRLWALMNKYQKSIDTVVEILETLKYTGIKVALCVMFGFPTETEEEAYKTLEFLANNSYLYDRVSIREFNLENGTPVFTDPKRFGVSRIYYDDKTWGSRCSYRYSVKNGISHEEAIHFVKKAKRVLAKVGK